MVLYFPCLLPPINSILSSSIQKVDECYLIAVGIVSSTLEGMRYGVKYNDHKDIVIYRSSLIKMVNTNFYVKFNKTSGLSNSYKEETRSFGMHVRPGVQFPESHKRSFFIINVLVYLLSIFFIIFGNLSSPLCSLRTRSSVILH